MALVDLNENTYSLGLNGTNQYASITDAAQTGLDITGDITIEAWIKLEQLPSSRFNIASKATEPVTSTNFAYSLSIDNSNKKLQFIFANGSGSLVTNATYTESGFGSGDVGKWIHVAVTADVSSSTIIFYIDGVAKTSSYYQRTATAIANSSDPFHIGAQGDPKDYFDGRIQEVRVWNDIRTAREIRENMYVQLEGTESNLQGYWRLNLGSGDETSNNNDLTLNNSPVFYQDIPFITTKTNIASTYLTRAGTTSGDYWYIT